MQPDSEIERLAHETIGAAIEVHRQLGPGILEGVYAAALAVELGSRKVPFQRQVSLDVYYKGVKVGESRLDFLIDGTLLVELKVVDALLPIHQAQLLSYLKALNRPLGLLINFKVVALRDGLQPVIRSN